MARICIVTGAHLCRNPRVVKEATALADAGHDVTVLGPATDNELASLDRNLTDGATWTHRYPVDIRPTAGWRRTWYRLQRRLAQEAKRQLGRDSAAMVGYGLGTMLRAADAERADLTIGHQEVGTWVCAQLARRGRRIGVDIEDWYSQHPHVSERDHHAIGLLQQVEGEALRHAAYAVTTSHALATALADAYDAPLPSVVYNAFPWSDREALDDAWVDRPRRDRLSLHWVSQTIGPDRGLGVLFEALRQVSTPVEVHLRGRLSAEHQTWLDASFPTGIHQLEVHDLVPPQELLSRIAEHDVGLALETSETVNHDLTASNKILHYLLGGLAVIATQTSGQAEVASQAPEAISLVEEGNALAMAQVIETLASTPEMVSAGRRAALHAAESLFCWEQQSAVVIDAVNQALSTPPPRITS